jgi:multidrug resistance protein
VGKSNFDILAVLWLSLFVAMFGMGIMAPLLPTYAEDLGASGFFLGVIFGSFSLARLVVMPFIGQWSDRRGRKPFLVMGLGLMALSSIGFLASHTSWELLGMRAVQGVAGAMVMPVAMALVGDISPPGRESTYMGYLSVAIFIGFGFGPLAGGFVKDFLSFKANFMVLGALCLVALLGVLFFLPASPVGTAQNNNGVVPYAVLLRNPAIRGMFFFRATVAFGRGTISVLLPLFGEHVAGLTTSRVGIIISANILTTAFLQPLFGRWADRWGRRRFIVAGTLLHGPLLILIPLFRSFETLLAVNMLMGLAGAMALPAASGIVTAEGKKGGMGGSMALFNMGMSLGLAFGPIFGGLAQDLSGYAGAFTIGGAVVLAGLVPLMVSGRGPAAPVNGEPVTM